MPGFARMASGCVREAQRLWARLLPAQAPREVEPAQAALVAQVNDWFRQYLARPHPRLGREGPVCPFAQPALDAGQLEVAVLDHDGKSKARLRGTLLRLAAGFAARLRGPEPSMYASLVIVFPRLAADRAHLLDELHDELKSSLMSAGTMVAAFHPASQKPALRNPDFHVLRAPFAGFAFRRMDVRDIVFVAHNRKAFHRYQARFGPRFARGEISDEHGYATAYAQAVARFEGRGSVSAKAPR